MYAIPLSQICKPTGRLSFSDPEELREAFRIPQGAQLMLVANADDETMNNYWIWSRFYKSWKVIRDLRFDVATSFSYSVWDKASRRDQIVNQRRGLGSFDILTDQGVPTIPFIFCADEPEDYEAAAQWLADRPEIKVVADLAQQFENETEFTEFVRRLHCFLRLVPQELKILIVGACTTRKFRLLFKEFGNVSIVTSEPAASAIFGGKELLHDLVSRPAPLFTREQLLGRNIRQVDKVANEEWRALQQAV